MNNRIPPREAIIQRLRSYSMSSRHARNVEQLLLLLLTSDEAFNLRNSLLIDLLALGREGEKRVQRLFCAGLGVFIAHACRVEGAAICRGERRVLKGEGGGEVSAADGFLEAAWADEQRGVLVAVPMGVL